MILGANIPFRKWNGSIWEKLFPTMNDFEGLAGAGRTTETVKGVNDALLTHKAESASEAHGGIDAGTLNTDVQEILTFLLPTDTRSWIPTTFDATTPTKPTHIDIKDGATVVATLDMTWDADGNITQLVASDGETTVTYTVSWTDGVWQGTTKAVV